MALSILFLVMFVAMAFRYSIVNDEAKHQKERADRYEKMYIELLDALTNPTTIK